DGLAVGREADAKHERRTPVEAGIGADRDRRRAVVPLARIEALAPPPDSVLDEEVLALLVGGVAARVEDRPLARPRRIERRVLPRGDGRVDRADLGDGLAHLDFLAQVDREDLA